MNREDMYSDENKEENNNEMSEDTLEQTSERSELPSRREIHQQKQERDRDRFKVKYPVIKILVAFFILLPIVIYGWMTFGVNDEAGKKEDAEKNTSGYETVDVNNGEDKNTSFDVNDALDADKNESIEEPGTKKDATGDEGKPTADVGEREKPEQPQASEEIPTVGKDKEEEKPPVKEPEKVEEEKPTPAPEKKEAVNHTVQANDTLYSISMKYFQSQSGIDKIKSANNLQDNNIRIGQVLKIPLD